MSGGDRMAVLGLDFAGGIPSSVAITAAGYQFVLRYLTDGGAELPGKLLTRTEYLDRQAHGIAVAVNFETTADRMLSGYEGGVRDAQTATGAINLIGYPTDRPVFFSADYDFTPAEQPSVDAYLTGAASVIGKERVGLYADFYLVDRCLANGTACWFWQASAWSGGQIHPSAHILQHIQTDIIDGVWCDINEALRLPDFGQHPPFVPHQEELVPWRLSATTPPLLAKTGTPPDKTWSAVEDTIAIPGALGTARVVFGNGGAWIQEAWFGPAGTHIVAPTVGLAVGQFVILTWPLPAGAQTLVLRYSAPSGGSVAFLS